MKPTMRNEYQLLHKAHLMTRIGTDESVSVFFDAVGHGFCRLFLHSFDLDHSSHPF